MKKKSGYKNRAHCFSRALAILITAGLVISLFGCSSRNSGADSFQIAFVSLSVNENAISEYGTFLTNEMPELTIDGKAPVFIPIIAGETRNDYESGKVNDPMAVMGGMMRLATLGATGALDVVIADMDNAARQARGDMFIPLADIFTRDELSSMENRFLSFDKLNTDGYEPVPTGEKTPVCGINITGNARMRSIFGNQEIGVFIAASTKNPELAKKVALSLL